MYIINKVIGIFLVILTNTGWVLGALLSQSGATSLPGYAVITTNDIYYRLTMLSAYVDHLQQMGYQTWVATEDNYKNCQGPLPNGTAEKIRTWLKENYIPLGLQYVLLIGNPDPDDPSEPDDTVGDIPMKMCWPGKESSPSSRTPTDYYYADLTGNWDLDGDQYYGEKWDDEGWQGVDFMPEVYVGRIPCYNREYAVVDSILQKIIRYETVAEDISWRKKVLLPMPMVYKSIDASNVGEFPGQVIENLLQPHGFSHYVLYEKEGLAPVPDADPYDNPDHRGISRENLLAAWQQQYGCVVWNAHGSDTCVSRTYWHQDKDENKLPGEDEIMWKDFLSSTDTESLDNRYPSMVYALSCNNGYPECSNNLAAAVLKKGGIGVIAATRVSYGPSLKTGTGGNMAYDFLNKLLVHNLPLGQALYRAKDQAGANWANRMTYNLYGPPSVHLRKLFEFAETDTLFPESEMEVSVPVTLKYGLGQAAIRYVIAGGNAVGGSIDYTLGEGILHFASGETEKYITVTLHDDALDEYDEMVKIMLRDPVNALVGDKYIHTIVILDNDPKPLVSLGPSAWSVGEAAGSLAVPLFLSVPSGRQVTVPFTLSGSATYGEDYQFRYERHSSLNIAPGDSSGSIVFSLFDDNQWEGDNETIIITFADPVNGGLSTAREYQITVIDNEEEPRIDEVFPNPARLAWSGVVRFQGYGVGTLEVFSLAGDLVFTATGGRYTNDRFTIRWNGTGPAKRKLALGTYLYKMEYEQKIETGKVMLLP